LRSNALFVTVGRMVSLCCCPTHAQVADDVFDWPTSWTAAIAKELYNSFAVALLA
jgi:hypothetical protein